MYDERGRVITSGRCSKSCWFGPFLIYRSKPSAGASHLRVNVLLASWSFLAELTQFNSNAQHFKFDNSSDLRDSVVKIKTLFTEIELLKLVGLMKS